MKTVSPKFISFHRSSVEELVFEFSIDIFNEQYHIQTLENVLDWVNFILEKLCLYFYY
jgi:hypothetical protein